MNDLLHTDFGESTFRKKRAAFDKMLKAYQKTVSTNDNQIAELDKKLKELRKERIKLQTANVERNRIDRSEARHEMYYEYIGSLATTLPLPDFCPLYIQEADGHYIEYLCCISDLHYGATFASERNEYSPAIATRRLEELASNLRDFITVHKLSKLHIACLGDTIQGCLRMSDLKINDSSVVKATVEVSRLIASFLNSLSQYVKIEYYHVPSANHTQLRPLGSKASELADEDMEYVIGNYIKDLCSNNERIHVHLAESEKQFIDIPINGFRIGAMHGHQLKNVESALKDFSLHQDWIYDYLVIGHFHGGKELIVSERSLNDMEVLICPSFIGSDPYADKLMRGSKAAVKIFGFDEYYGHTETYKIILN